jgi:hypothetical protein
VGVPIVLLRQSFIDAVVEVLVVGEDDMSTDIIELEHGRLASGSWCKAKAKAHMS